MQIITESWKRLWNVEEIRILVLVSLCLQFGLLFLSPWRKRTATKPLILLLWSFYLLADYIAILGLGNLLKKPNQCATDHQGNVDLMAFWGPFLLLHLGGPDTITAYSIEDNELWWRHFLGLAVQVAVAFMLLLQLLEITQLRIAASLVFIVGLLKYAERTWALRAASRKQLRDSIVKDNSGPNYEEFMHEYRKNMRAGLVEIPEHHIQSRAGRLRVHQAYKMVEMELSFLYDVFHTKTFHICCLRGFLSRFIYLVVVTVAFILFLNSEKHEYASADIVITYVLLGGAIFMEFASLVLIIISDWMIVTLQQHMSLRKLAIPIAKVTSCVFPKGKPRWSNSMRQYNLLSFILRERNSNIRRIMSAIKVQELWDNYISTHTVGVPSKLKELLFEEVKAKSMGARHMVDFKELRDWKGENILRREECDYLTWSVDKEFDKSIIIWHVATDVCFHTLNGINENPDTSHGRNCDSSHSDREISLILSNYMLYLLIMQPSMMPAGIGEMRFKDAICKFKQTCSQATNFLQSKEREALLHVNTEIDPEVEKRHGINSELILACRLAKELNRLAEDKRWRLISRVWVEMLGYAAINCKTYYHAKQLSQGGELLTHVWLLMTHMGMGGQYHIKA